MRRQLIFVGIGLVCFVVSSLIDYRLLKTLVPAGYIISVLALVAVLFTRPVNGARSWFQLGFVQIQPSEIGKVALILTLAAVLAPAHLAGCPGGGCCSPWCSLPSPWRSSSASPTSTMMVWGFIALIMLYAGGTSMRQFFCYRARHCRRVGFAQAELADYQITRLTSFLDRYRSLNRPAGTVSSRAGHRERRAVRQGPVPRHPDRVELCSLPADRLHLHRGGEQLGFVGAGLVLVLFLVIVWRLLVIGSPGARRFRGLIAVGVAAFVVVHTFVNVDDHRDHAGDRAAALVHELRRVVLRHHRHCARFGALGVAAEDPGAGKPLPRLTRRPAAGTGYAPRLCGGVTTSAGSR